MQNNDLFLNLNNNNLFDFQPDEAERDSHLGISQLINGNLAFDDSFFDRPLNQLENNLNQHQHQHHHQHQHQDHIEVQNRNQNQVNNHDEDQNMQHRVLDPFEDRNFHRIFHKQEQIPPAPVYNNEIVRVVKKAGRPRKNPIKRQEELHHLHTPAKHQSTLRYPALTSPGLGATIKKQQVYDDDNYVLQEESASDGYQDSRGESSPNPRKSKKTEPRKDRMSNNNQKTCNSNGLEALTKKLFNFTEKHTDTRVVKFDEVQNELQVIRRRAYDIVNILEGGNLIIRRDGKQDLILFQFLSNLPIRRMICARQEFMRECIFCIHASKQQKIKIKNQIKRLIMSIPDIEKIFAYGKIALTPASIVMIVQGMCKNNWTQQLLIVIPPLGCQLNCFHSIEVIPTDFHFYVAGCVFMV